MQEPLQIAVTTPIQDAYPLFCHYPSREHSQSLIDSSVDDFSLDDLCIFKAAFDILRSATSS